MVKRLVWLTGAAAATLSLARLGRLLQPQESGPDWQVVLAAAVVLGITFTWVARAYRLSPIATVAVNAVGMGIALLRITAPSTLVMGVLPSAETWSVVETEMSFAWEIIRFGAAPVLPVAGLVAVLAAVYWVIGAVGAVGALTDRPALVTIPAIGFYLQLATLDRRSPGMGWLLAFVLIGGLTVLSLASPGDSVAGKLRARSGMLIPRVSAGVAAVVAVAAAGLAIVATNAFASTVPESGTLQWRTQTGIGSGLYGGTSFNLFVGMQQSLVSLSDEPLFYARVSENSPPNDELYWKLISLDAYDGENWLPGDLSWETEGLARWEREDMAFQGDTVPVAGLVQIAGLRESILPTLYSPYALTSDEDLIQRGFRVREDGAVGLNLRTNQGWQYQIESNIPVPDLSYLASAGGELSPIFEEAATAGVFDGEASDPVFGDRPEDIGDYLELPDDTAPEVRNIARTVTDEGTTSFEKALLLESWLRDPRNFRYSTDVDTGHSSLDLADWLLDAESQNYRTGYCEQFATAMSVMARTLGIPSRVVLGFTPGDVEQQADGSDVIVVRERNAHAWVELWMNGQGWVRFDPTPRSDGINEPLVSEVGFDLRQYVPAPEEIDSNGVSVTPGERLELGPEILNLPGDATPDLTLGTDRSTPVWIWVLLVAGLLAALLPAYKWNRRRRRLAAIRAGNIDAAWAEIVDRLADLRAPLPEHETALELARRHHDDLVPLATLYSASAYGGKPRGDGRSAFAAADDRLNRRYGRADRVKASLRIRSLRR